MKACINKKIKQKHRISIKRINNRITIITSLPIILISLFINIINIQITNINYNLYLDSEIILKIKGNGEQQILTYDFNFCPNFIYLNEEKDNKLNNDTWRKIYINPEENQEINTVKLIWNSTVPTMQLMFQFLNNIIEVDLSNFDSSEVTDMAFMFQGCHSITSINFQNFNSSLVTTMECLFFQCFNLKELDLSNFKTPKLTHMELLFFECKNLTSVNMENFDTSNVIQMDYLFFRCYNLKNLSLSNFDTSKVEKMNYMFAECNSLESLDLSMFNTSSVKDIEFMFNSMSLLTSLNLNNFDTSKVTNMNSLFEGCWSLKYLNISNFDTSEVINMDYMFKSCPHLEYLDLSSFDIPKLESMKEMFNGCENLEYINFVLFKNINAQDNFLDFLSNTPENIVICINIDNSGELSQIINNKLCPTIYCGDDWRIKKKFILENNTCIEGYFIDTTSEVEISTYNYQNLSTALSIIGTVELDNIKENQRTYDKIINNILKDYNGANGEEIILKGENNSVFRLSTSENIKNGNNNESAQLSKIDLGQCEEELRDNYNFNDNITLIILTLEKITNVSSERNLQFEVYESLNKTRLNLSICKDTPIDIYIPLIISDELNDLYNELKDLGYDLFNINDKFYQDICTPYKSSNNTDVLLADRINDYYNNNETQCQSGCSFANYSFETQNLKCYCHIEKSEINLKIGENDDTKYFYKSFYEVLKYSNYKVLKCYKLAFKPINFTNNYGCILTVIYFIIYFIFFILFCIKGTTNLKKEISKFLSEEKAKENQQNKIPINFAIRKSEKGLNNIRKIRFTKQIEAEILINKEGYKRNSRAIKGKSIRILNNKNKLEFPPRKYSNISLFEKRRKTDSKNNFINSRKSLGFSIEAQKTKKSLFKLPLNQKNKKLDNFELNNLDYREALKLDKRPINIIYWSLLKREHVIIFTFFIRNDHNILSVKVSRLFFLICTDMALNVFFFSDESMHKIYLDYGKYNFIQQIPQILYSTVVSQIIQVFLCFLSLTDKHYYQVKNLDNKNRKLILAIFRCIKLKIIFFYIFTFIMFIFYWYTISCFCAVYQNTQIIFIKDSLSSFGLGLIYPFALYLFPAVLRTISLKFCLGKLSIIYKLSDIIPFF